MTILKFTSKVTTIKKANCNQHVIFINMRLSSPEMFTLSAHFQTVLKNPTYDEQVEREEGVELTHTKIDLNFFASDKN